MEVLREPTIDQDDTFQTKTNDNDDSDESIAIEEIVSEPKKSDDDSSNEESIAIEEIFSVLVPVNGNTGSNHIDDKGETDDKNNYANNSTGQVNGKESKVQEDKRNNDVYH